MGKETIYENERQILPSRLVNHTRRMDDDARRVHQKSTYTGPSDGTWGDAANWSPAIVRNNGGGQSFAATIANVFLTLDLDVTVNRLTFNPGDGKQQSS